MSRQPVFTGYVFLQKICIHQALRKDDYSNGMDLTAVLHLRTMSMRPKKRGVKDLCFAKRRGIKVADMRLSEYVHKRLRKFRAGIESGISWLKRSFGLGRCTWKGWEFFQSYVWAVGDGGELAHPGKGRVEKTSSLNRHLDCRNHLPQGRCARKPAIYSFGT